MPEPSVPQNLIIYITDIVPEDRKAIFEGFDQSRMAELDMDRYRKLLVTATHRLAYHSSEGGNDDGEYTPRISVSGLCWRNGGNTEMRLCGFM